jgi:hypothetical protein
LDAIRISFYYYLPKQFFLNHFKGGCLIKQKFPYLIFRNPCEPAKLFYRNKSIFVLFVLFADPLQQITCCPCFFACNILHILCIQYDTLRYPFRQILHKIVKTGRFQQPGAIPATDIFMDKISNLFLYCNGQQAMSNGQWATGNEQQSVLQKNQRDRAAPPYPGSIFF